MRVLCPTWPPAAQSAPSTATGNERRKLNAWILNSGECDDVVDWDAVLRGNSVSDEYDPAYFSDGIHPNPAGHAALADAVPLRWFPAAAAANPAAPAPAGCASRRMFTIHLRAPRGDRIRRARVYVGRRRVRVVRRHGRFTARVDLRGLPRRTVRVRIVLRSRSGTRYRHTRRYHPCRPR